MADRNSAEIFSSLFTKLASEYGEACTSGDFDPRLAIDAILRVARQMWQESFRYDFSHSQLECDGALIQLGLARRQDGIEYLNSDLETWS